MKNKRSQQELIVTVLLVLIAIVAVVLIASFIVRYVREGTAAASGKAQCAKLQLEVVKTESSTMGSNVTIRRGDNNALSASNVVVMQQGVLWSNSTTSIPGALATSVIKNSTSAGLTNGNSLEVSVILSDGTVCTGVTTATVSN